MPVPSLPRTESTACHIALEDVDRADIALGRNTVPVMTESLALQEFAIDVKTNKCGYYCEGGCGEGTCIGPNTCSCKPGYKLQGNTCIPDCPKGCLNGECIAPNKCSCKPGWTLDIAGSKCTPHCSETCLNGDCVAPDTCACKNGLVRACW
ncbi:unnamed protein product [Acanthoscelides obtectus]|uniref:EGF-like domain-containing protein n=1 Tax=Acanthoscelides obtectus TaxID=200917 RepID=A0A9P0L946_ACAOB|nr:unnamed protein product [Acanthoscelides obtectus]CAK1687778.1 von Willebrand factor D and EGF domain-containing protein [Acanthoscelides obtectus]